MDERVLRGFELRPPRGGGRQERRPLGPAWDEAGVRGILPSYAKVPQTVNAGRLLAPRTRVGMRLCMRSVSFLFRPLMTLPDRSATDIALED